MIDTSKLKLKHHLRVHTLVEGYPSEEDVLFEIVSFLADRGISEFSETLVRQAFSFECPSDRVAGTLEPLINSGYFERTKRMGVYRLVKHPWQ